MSTSTTPDVLGLVGTTIADKYAIEGVVGEGGFAIVYRATHVLWKRPVAVKVFKALGEVAEHDRQKLLEDFIQEGALLADLSERSTAICQARDVGMLKSPRGEQIPYMVLEWLEGKPLESVLADERTQNAPLRSLEQTVRFLDPIAEALALAHKKGIAHRDIKPANIFVLGDPRGHDVGLKLLDFGIAKVVQDAQKMGFGKTAGHITSFTPSYGAAEQFNRAYGSTGPWTDVFAFALVVGEVVAGREPLSGDSLVQLAYAASDPNVRPTPRTMGVQISNEAEEVFQKAVAVKPVDRYQSAGEFWNALRTVVIGHPMSTIISTRSGEQPVVAAASTVVDSSPGSDLSNLSNLGVGATALAPSPNTATSIGAGGPSSNPSTAIASAIAVGPASVRTGGGANTGLIIGAVLAAIVVVGGGIGYAVHAKNANAGGGGVAGGGGGTSSSASPQKSVSSAAASTSAVVVSDNKTCPPGMKKISGGEYFMGSDEKEAEPNEKPPHKVKLAPYCLDELEVSVKKYKACSDRGACLRAGKENIWTHITPAQQKIYDPLCNATDPVKRGDHPINCVDWEQARKYCEVNDSRLPTEAEWEYAARGSDGRIYPWGDEAPNALLLNACGKECVAWMHKNKDPDQPIAAMYEEDDGWPATAPVGSFPKGKSSWGIQDIVGNVWEWVADYYADYDPGSATTMATDPKGPQTGTDRVIRGGAWNGAMPAWVRPAWRFHTLPGNRTHGTGFRCAKSL